MEFLFFLNKNQGMGTLNARSSQSTYVQYRTWQGTQWVDRLFSPTIISLSCAKVVPFFTPASGVPNKEVTTEGDEPQDVTPCLLFVSRKHLDDFESALRFGAQFVDAVMANDQEVGLIRLLCLRNRNSGIWGSELTWKDSPLSLLFVCVCVQEALNLADEACTRMCHAQAADRQLHSSTYHQVYSFLRKFSPGQIYSLICTSVWSIRPAILPPPLERFFSFPIFMFVSLLLIFFVIFRLTRYLSAGCPLARVQTGI